MPKIAITTSSFDVEGCPPLRQLSAAGYEFVINPYGRRMLEGEVRELLSGDVLGMIAGVEPLTRSVLFSARSLKYVSRCGIGLDNVDLAAAAERGISVMNTPDAPSMAVAEYSIGLMLALLRRVAEADRAIRGRIWKPLMGRLLGAQTVGLVGFGRIGRKVAALLLPFGARVLAYDPAPGAPVDGVLRCSLDEVLTRSDIVSLHLPYSESNHHCLGHEQLSLMKKGALLVNAARGGLVDERALAECLASGALGGAAIDTFEKEPYDGPLAAINNVVLTSHMGSYAQESRVQQELEAAENLVTAMRHSGLLR